MISDVTDKITDYTNKISDVTGKRYQRLCNIKQQIPQTIQIRHQFEQKIFILLAEIYCKV